MDDIVKYVRYISRYGTVCSPDMEPLEYDGCLYQRYIAKDGSGFKFYSVQIGLNLTKAQVKQDTLVRVKALSSIDDIPVLVCDMFTYNIAGFGNEHRNRTVLDLSDSDFSNILSAREMFRGIDTSNTTVNMSKHKDKMLRPMSVVNMFSFAELTNIQEIFCEIDFSRVIDASDMFYMSNGKHIDIGQDRFKSLESAVRMFAGSSIETVSGRIGSNKLKDISGIFGFCTNLISVDKKLFEGSKIINLESAYTGCTSLKNPGISADSIEDGANLRDIFNNTDGVDIKLIIPLLSKVGKNNTHCGHGIFSRWKKDIYLNDSNIELSSCLGLLSDVESYLVDISAVDIHSNKLVRGILDIFDPEYIDGFRSKYGNFAVIAASIGMRLIPNIVITNNSTIICEADYKVFNIINMVDCSLREISAKIDLTKAMQGDENLLIIVKKGWNMEGM